MEKIYFEDKQVKEVTEATTGWVGLQYVEGTNPSTEVMHKDEWEAGKSDKPSNDRQAIFVKSSEGIQRSILDTLEMHNVRFQEVGRILDWVNESMMKARDRVMNACYGTKDWLSELTVDMLGETPKLEDEEIPHALAVYETLKERGVMIKDVGRVLQTTGNIVNRAQVQKLERELGREMKYWRMDDLSQYVENVEAREYANNQKNSEGVQSDAGESQPVVGADGGTDTQPSVQESTEDRPSTE